MIDKILKFFGLCRLSEKRETEKLYWQLIQDLYETKKALEKARKNNHRDERGRFTKAPK